MREESTARLVQGTAKSWGWWCGGTTLDHLHRVVGPSNVGGIKAYYWDVNGISVHEEPIRWKNS